jgi:8-oxo-dGTP pyrophosphatase MutT (NUDIX family)
VDELGANGAGAVADPEAAVEAQVGLPPGSDVGARIPSAVLVCLFEEAGEARVILTRRSRDLRFHKGEVSFPGGRCERGETPAQGALREASEEISLDSDAVTIAGQLSPLLTLSSQSLIVPVVGTLVERPVLEASPAEVEFVFDVALADLVADDVWREERWRFGPGRGGRPIPEDIPRQIVHPPVTDDGSFPVWFFELPGDTVWGATARVLVELLRTVLSV